MVKSPPGKRGGLGAGGSDHSSPPLLASGGQRSFYVMGIYSNTAKWGHCVVYGHLPVHVDGAPMASVSERRRSGRWEGHVVACKDCVQRTCEYLHATGVKKEDMCLLHALRPNLRQHTEIGEARLRLNHTLEHSKSIDQKTDCGGGIFQVRVHEPYREGRRHIA